MSDAPPPDPQPLYGDFYREIYAKGVFADERPTLPIAAADLEARCRDGLDERATAYIFGGAGSEDTMRANLEAFRRVRVVPRVLRDISHRDLSTTVLGSELPAPIGLAPIGVQVLVHEEGEAASAKAAGAHGVPFVTSTAAGKPMEEIAEANGDGSPRWFQLYWPGDPELAESLVNRAEASGYTAIVLTVDNAFPGWKPRDLEQAYLPFLEGIGIAQYLSDPVFLAGLDQTPEENIGAAVGHFLGVFSNAKLTWDDLDWLRSKTDLPIVLKGILHPGDAREARDRGVDGVVVSNHGGRQIDGAIAALDALPGVVGEAGDEMTVMLDSGVRGGADAFKALALGADLVLIGRPYLWALALEGEQGVHTLLRSILAELDLTMALAGATTVEEIGADLITNAG